MSNYTLSPETITEISRRKEEPSWMLEVRLEALETFKTMPNPQWGPDISEIDFNKIQYYTPGESTKSAWESIPQKILNDFEKIGVPQRERKFLAGVSTQYDSEIIYHNFKKRFENTGVIFESIENGLKKYPHIFREYFGKIISAKDNKYAALNTAFWSGGSFVYVPKGIKLVLPIETYFRINAKALGQFERTLIIAQEKSSIHYIEGCTAPQYLASSLHCGVVEIFAMKQSHVTYTTLQNWSTNVYNLVTKRALAKEEALVEWVDCNIGSKITMKYPSVILEGDRSVGKLTSLTLASNGQQIDSGGKMIHIGKETQSIIRSKTVCSNGGTATYRGLSKITKEANNSRAFVDCDSLILDIHSKSLAIPEDVVENSSSVFEHEAYISNISQDQLHYLMSKGISEDRARDLIVQGFAESIVQLLPNEYSVELERILFHFSKKEGYE